MKPLSLSRSGSPWVRGAAVSLGTAGLLVSAGLGTAPALSAPVNPCPEAYPVAEVAKDQAVTGLTTSSGTTPTEFTGTVLGVLEDGIAPDVDMILARMTSPEVDRVGIWSGMSGSPVYAEDGRLIGAVAYGLAFGPSTVAGITPAADMYEVIQDDAPLGRMAERVEIPERMQSRMVAEGAATEREAEEGMSRLRLPLGVAGMSTAPNRLTKFAKRIDRDDMRVVRMGTAAASDEDVNSSPATPGGNLAAAISYGDITAAGVGTTTAVCGEDIVGFGHPMLWTGPSTMSLHGADAIYVQEDPTFPGFKVANIGGPIGTIDQDRWAAIAGFVGDLPTSGQISTEVSSGSKSRTGTTNVNIPEWMTDLGFAHIITNLDRVYDGVGKGSGAMEWTISGTREDGSPFEVSRSDIFGDRFDITFDMTLDVAMAMAMIQFNEVEDVTIDDVSVNASVERAFENAKIRSVQVRQFGEWVPVKNGRTIQLRAGKYNKIKIVMSLPDRTELSVVIPMGIKRGEIGSFGYLSVFGGGSGGEDEFFDEGGSDDEGSFDEVLAEIRKAPHNDEAVLDLNLFTETGGDINRVRKTSVGKVVMGSRFYEVQIIG